MSTPLRAGDPARLGAYELVSRLGSGGMGTVYLGRAPGGRQVAVKTLRTEYVWDSELRGRFRSEVNRLREVPPFCTAAVLDADPDHEPPYLVVEYVAGPSLADEIRSNGPLGPDLLHSVIIGATAALAAIHGAGVVHRDFKPNNVLISLGSVKVIDFGIARPLDVTSAHTLTGQMVGTVEYMAPECFDTTSGSPVSPAADIFAWGVLVAFAATGRTPFGAHSAPATAMRIATQPPDLTGLNGQLRSLVGRALAKRPADRPTARELLDVLLGHQTPPTAPPPAAHPTPAPGPRPALSPSQRPAPSPSQRSAPSPSQRVSPSAALRPTPPPDQRSTPLPGRPPSTQGAHPVRRSSSTPAPVRHDVPAKDSRTFTRVFVILMVLTGMLGTILTATVYFLIEGGLDNLP
ncbi:serine/threonine protein kinase [Actinoplanes sp. NPDC049265]|uniref:serine/threonine protein kinase n=1 Tax=Actinoplanes sp. NPDC049265 TaxID=3363902 RepID=UPI0037124AE3